MSIRIEWSEPPAEANGGRSITERAAFAAALRAHPMKWAKWPFSASRSRTSLHTTASRIRNGHAKTIGSGFETEVHQDTIYIRFVGGIKEVQR